MKYLIKDRVYYLSNRPIDVMTGLLNYFKIDFTEIVFPFL